MTDQAGEKVKRLFAAGDPHGRIALVWSHNPPGELAAWSRCYQASAKELAQSLLERSFYADREACPIVFLYRHALELCLKALLLEAAELYNKEGESPPFSKKVLGDHDLRPLATPLESVFKRFSWRRESKCEKGHVPSYDDVLRIVNELDQFDSKSFAFRYPIDKSFKLPLLPHSLDFNLHDFVLLLDPVLETLQSLVDAVDSENDFLYEQQFWGESEKGEVDA